MLNNQEKGSNNFSEGVYFNRLPKNAGFHEFQKPLIGLTPESFLDYGERVIPKNHVCRGGNFLLGCLEKSPCGV
ncbi:MAG TPA: hypothetical protein ACFYDZ_07510 [Candidatus Brocadiaceae bacterium]